VRASCVILLAAVVAGCAAHAPALTVYDFDAIEPAPAAAARLEANITVPSVSAPSWLASTALAYRFAYTSPSLPRSYARSRWTAPPAELLTDRLRQLLGSASSGITLTGGSGAGGYRLDVTLEQLEQVYSTPQASQGRVSLRVTVSNARDGRVLAQRSFQAERRAPSPDAAGAARALVEGSDQCLAELLGWLKSALPAPGAH
jgi:cholesterol transport system auxiliary component